MAQTKVQLIDVGNVDFDNLNATGIITATSFVGSGASLTGIVTATSFVGSGASLTDLPGGPGAITVSSDTTDGAAFPVFTNTQTGSNAPKTNTNLRFDATNGNLQATTFTGSGSGLSDTPLTVSSDTTDGAAFPVFTNTATGNNDPKTNTSLQFNASTGNLQATTFTGSGSGLSDTKITQSIDDASVATHRPVFIDAGAGDKVPKVNTNLSFIPSTGTLSATTFSGSGSGLSNTPLTPTNEAVDASNFIIFTNTATGNNDPKTNTSLQFDASNGTLSATTFSGSGSGLSNTPLTPTDETTDTFNYIIFTNAATGNNDPKTNTSLRYNANNGNVTATTFTGDEFKLALNIFWTSGSGSPEGVVSANRGSLYSRTDGGSGTTLYVKESGTGNTGWAAK